MAVLLYALLAAAALLAKGFNPAADTLGDGLANPDWSGHMWSFWQACQSLRGDDAVLSSELILYPHGMSMGMIHGDFLTTRIAGVFWWLGGQEFGWPLFVMFLLVGNGVGGTLLVGTITGSRVAGVLGGLLLMFSGYGSWAINTGNVEYATWLWTCLYLTCLNRMLRRPTVRCVVSAGVFGALAVLGNFTDGYHLPLFTLSLVAWQFRRIRRAHIVGLAATAGIAGVLVAPMGVLVARDHVDRPPVEEIQEKKADGKSIIPEEPKYDSHRRILDAPEEARALEEYLPRPTLGRPFASVFVLAQLLLFGIGVTAWRWRGLPWLASAGLFALLCFGRDLSKLDADFGAGIPMPFAWLEAVVPFYDLVHYPIRLSSYCLLAWVVLVGMGARRIFSSDGPRWQHAFVWAAVVPALLQPFFGWYTRVIPAVETSPFHHQLAAEEGDGAVISVPFTLYLGDSAYLADQTVHGKPMFNGCALQHVGLDPSGGLVARNAMLAEIDRLQHEVLEQSSAVMHARIERAPRQDPADLEAARKELVELGFHHLLLHKRVPFFHGAIRVDLDSPLAAFLHGALGEPVYDDPTLAAFDLRGSKGSGTRSDWAGRAEALRGLALEGPARDGCATFDSLTVLLDGHTVADPAYHAGGSPHGQPSVVLAVTEPDGREEAVVVDLGESIGTAAHNFGQWLGRAPEGASERLPSATVISHLHTLRMFLPGPEGGKGSRLGPEEFRSALARLALGEVRGSNLDAFCEIAAETPAAPLCERPLVTLEPGLEPLVWRDGTASDRVHLLTSPIDDHGLPFVPTETAIVVSTETGYLVYSVCSHMPARTHEHRTPPFHVVQQLVDAMRAGSLPEGPIHTLVTGGCGMEARAGAIARDHGESVHDVYGREIQRLQRELGVRRVVLTHCGIDLSHHYRVAFGDDLTLAVPGSCVPLSLPSK